MRSIPTSCPTIDLPLVGAVAFSTLRGCSDPDSAYDGFNVCGYTGDDPVHIAACRRAAADKLGLESHELLILPRQTHTANVAVVDRSSACQPLTDVDAVVTADCSIAIGVNTADCVPIILCDPEAGVIGAVHSGWRGTFARIAARTIAVMVTLGASAENISAAIGPFIHVADYEVGRDLADRFVDEFGDIEGLVRNYDGRPHLDLDKAVTNTLTEAGINPDNICRAGRSSYSCYGDFYSARRLGVSSGRTLTAARLARSKASM